MEWERQRAYDFADGKKEGLEQGAQQKAIEAAKNLKQNGVSIELISKCIGLSVEEISKL